VLALAIVAVRSRGERSGLAATIAVFGGVFFSDSLANGAPAIERWAHGSFPVLSLLSLAALSFSDSRAMTNVAASDA
jgi:hypothetical protein